MKIAVINTVSSIGGYRWLIAVFGAIKKYYPDVLIDLINDDTRKIIPDSIHQAIKDAGINQIELSMPLSNKTRYKKKTKIKYIDDWYHKIREKRDQKRKLKLKKHAENFLNKNYDLVFNSWPYANIALNLKIPYFFIPHDFIMNHFFGLHCGNVYKEKTYLEIKENIKKYFEAGAIPCVSSDFIANELKRTYPNYKGEVNVIYGAAMGNTQQLSEMRCQEILKKFDITNDYIIYPTNNMHHKNMQAAISAYYYIKQKYPNIKMISCGFKEPIRIKVNLPYYGDHVSNTEDYDIKSVGIVTDEELVGLIQKAKLLINVSLCEAGCGSGIDAWSIGTPTAISDIPAYRNQVNFLGVKTEFFNPKNPEDIASAVIRILDNFDSVKENAQISQEILTKEYTAKDVADRYMELFQKEIEREKHE